MRERVNYVRNSSNRMHLNSEYIHLTAGRRCLATTEILPILWLTTTTRVPVCQVRTPVSLVVRRKKKKYKLRIRICNCLTLNASTHIREMCGGSCLCDEAVATAVLRYKRSVWSSYEFSGRPGE